MSTEQDIQLAAQAVKELRNLAGEKSSLTDAKKLINDRNLSDVFKILKKRQLKEAIAPVTAYLKYVPLVSGTGTGSFYQAPQPTEAVVEDAIAFLVFMGDKKAIPVLERIANTFRDVLIPAPDEWEYSTNAKERENAEKAIKIIRAIQKQGYKNCNICNGSGKSICNTCKGEGKIERIELKKTLFITKEIRHIETCWNCTGQASVECNTCKGFGKLLPDI